jgi:Tol biopolymer transport system component
MPLASGTRLGPYEIVAPLGAGGMGEVYRARDSRLGRDVAVKVLPEHLSASPEIRARFEREARAVSALAHPHICVLFDVGSEGETDYLVMELVEGETLAARLERGPLPVGQVIDWGFQIADALAQAHRAGIVHRDLKPANVMLTRSGVKLMDFGLARPTGLTGGGSGPLGGLTQSPTVAAPLTAEGTIIGTFQYMSPEQLEGKEADPRSDVWALGCVLYEMASGRRAFSGKSQASLIAAVMGQPEQPLSEVAPLAPPGLGRLVSACLAKDPDERVQTAHDVALQLDWLRRELSGSGSAPAAARSARRWRVPALAAAGIVLAAAAFFVGRGSTDRAARPAPTFERLTYETQAIFNARFLPDGQSIVMSSALDGSTPELSVVRAGSPTPQKLGQPGLHLLAVSSTGELAVLDHARFTGHHRLFTGTLARMPLEGQAPRDLMDNVREADWSPDGRDLVVVHDVGGKDRLEFPPGKVLYESAGYLSDPRFSPAGDRIAFMEHPARFDDRGSVLVVDLNGKSRVLSGGYWGIEGLAWTPDGQRIYFSGARESGYYAVQGVDLAGHEWAALPGAGSLTLLDISRDGAWAVSSDSQPARLVFHEPSGAERDLSYLESGLSPILSGDAATLMFTDQSPQAGPNYSVDLRPTSGGAVVRLGEGNGAAFSSDGRRVLAYTMDAPAQVLSYPIGAGQPTRLDSGRFENVSDSFWLPGDQRVLVAGNEAGQPSRCWLLDPAAGTAQAVGPEGLRVCAPSPDGQQFLALGVTGWALIPLTGSGPPRPLTATSPHDHFVRWSPDGSAIFVLDSFASPVRVDRVEVATGRRSEALTVDSGDRAGRVSILDVSLADDLRSFVYTAWYYRSELYLVRGAR